MPNWVFSVDYRYGVDRREEAVLHEDVVGTFTELLDSFVGNPEGLSMVAAKLKVIKQELNDIARNKMNSLDSVIAYLLGYSGYSLEITLDANQTWANLHRQSPI